MIKPNRLRKGDKVAIVSLSSGLIGEPEFIHKYELGKKRLEEVFGLEVVATAHALKGIEFVEKHPELRAKDLMDAFKDDTIKGIICSIGGSDTTIIEPYIDYSVITNNPKVFMGYSDTTANHFMMQKAGVVSYYGPALMTDFAEYVSMFDYTKKAVMDTLFDPSDNYEMKSSQDWTDDFVGWGEDKIDVARKLKKEIHGYEVLQGSGTISGKLLGGCVDAFPIYVGTNIWPTLSEWKDKILFLETSEDYPTPELLTFYLYNLGFQGILDVVQGIIVGKPMNEKYYDAYKDVYTRVMKKFGKDNLPILYNVNFGHATPIGILPLGTEVKVDYDSKRIIFVENVVL